MFNGFPFQLDRFLIRLSMYVHPVNKSTIVSFIHGYEIGLKNDTFTKGLQYILTNKYEISYSGDGWPGQVSRLSRIGKLSWVDTFVMISNEYLGQMGEVNRNDK